jgi:hypothetical protein
MAKSTRPMVREHKTDTNQVIDREMNDAEFAQYEIDQAADVIRLASEEKTKLAKETARKLILDRLGITAEEAQLLLS